MHQSILTGAGLPEALAAILVDVDAAIERGLLAGTQRRSVPADRPPDHAASPDSVAAALKG